MECNWIKTSPSLSKGITIVNQLEEAKFEQFLKRIITKLKVQDAEMFTEDEKSKLEKIFKINQEQLALAIKSIIYVFKRMLKFIFMPVDLRSDLLNIGFNNEKADFFINIWSAETSITLNELALNVLNEPDDNVDISWKLNSELSSEYHRKCKIPKAYLCLVSNTSQTELELTRNELHSTFIKFESIQSEIDNLLQ